MNGIRPLDFAAMTQGAPSLKEAQDRRNTTADFAQMLSEQIGETNRLQNEAADLNQKAALGNAGVTLHEAQIASSKAELHLRFMVQVRNKALDAYKEIMSMPL
ncbi:MAG: flagellar hook-basal body complex protein FliE [Magnetococcales bacterium]|nr:flagellar hook-basal body complex protein FliE [Magnetococcales bacterium]